MCFTYVLPHSTLSIPTQKFCILKVPVMFCITCTKENFYFEIFGYRNWLCHFKLGKLIVILCGSKELNLLLSLYIYLCVCLSL